MKVEYIYKCRVLAVTMWPEYKEGTTDGDTMRFTVDVGFRIYPQLNFRIKDFDAPEYYRPQNELEKQHAIEARNYAKRLLMNKDVIIQTYKDPAAYGRYEAVIQLPDGQDFATVMTLAGMAKKENYSIQ